MRFYTLITEETKGVDIMAKGLLDLLADTISDLYWTDERKGRYGEKLTERKLNLINLFGRKGKTLKNISSPRTFLYNYNKQDICPCDTVC